MAQKILFFCPFCPFFASKTLKISPFWSIWHSNKRCFYRNIGKFALFCFNFINLAQKILFFCPFCPFFASKTLKISPFWSIWHSNKRKMLVILKHFPSPRSVRAFSFSPLHCLTICAISYHCARLPSLPLRCACLLLSWRYGKTRTMAEKEKAPTGTREKKKHLAFTRCSLLKGKFTIKFARSLNASYCQYLKLIPQTH